MKLSECKHGILVVTEDAKVGMIVGITNKAQWADGETRSKIEHAVPLVQFSGDLAPRGIHPSNLRVFKD
jgi:hypothetical protein